MSAKYLANYERVEQHTAHPSVCTLLDDGGNHQMVHMSLALKMNIINGWFITTAMIVEQSPSQYSKAAAVCFPSEDAIGVTPCHQNHGSSQV